MLKRLVTARIDSRLNDLLRKADMMTVPGEKKKAYVKERLLENDGHVGMTDHKVNLAIELGLMDYKLTKKKGP